MLRRLKVENYALIDRLELELDDRLNIITESRSCSARWASCWGTRTTTPP